MTRVGDISVQLVDDLAALDPAAAAVRGINCVSTELPDYSIEGIARRAEVLNSRHAELESAEPESADDEIGRAVALDRVQVMIEAVALGDPYLHLTAASNPAQMIRQAFEAMPTDTSDDWEVIAERMTKVQASVDGLMESLREGQQRGLTVSKRQARAVARQSRIIAGTEHGFDRFFGAFAAGYTNRGSVRRKLIEQIERNALDAERAFEGFAQFLYDYYLPNAAEEEGVGAERYAFAVRHRLGSAIDPIQTYEWGWQQLHEIAAQARAVAAEVEPGKAIHEVFELLDTDHERTVRGEASLRTWLQSLLERTIDELDGTHFDIPQQIREIAVRLAPPDGRNFAYYSAPSEDFRSPGTYWHQTLGRTSFPVWSELTTAYHEGVPGHHFQMGFARATQRLTRFQRTLFVSGHGEGWGLYAEGLMDELGYLDRPEYRLGMFASRMFRAARVVVDIGLHLGLTIPADETFHPGQRWTPVLADEMIRQFSAESDRFLDGEIDRYLGSPAQSISYLIGWQAWKDVRKAVETDLGSNFDLRRFHTEALSLGPMGLDMMRAEMPRRIANAIRS